jgi:hypothetical protein
LFKITFSSLGYESQTKHVTISKTQKSISLDVVLTEKLLELTEVIIQTDLPIKDIVKLIS